ncbi:transcription factor IIIB 50 kDa subunit [Ornithorhynchus anatinus]|uniref:Transcription factor IIIB 50 kDa subunit n=1 Tax=Ornithorhynchus anatinus TaxID=9258 RepID=A0A6I8P872_ORNAN|nr:transcription factor IIIB 50 kDa subunit [Ornithorhynchus anatinus]
MAGRSRCPECGSGEVVEDAHYAQTQVVCAQCGCVLTEGLLTTTFADEEHLREVTYSRSTGESEQVSRSQLRGLRRVKDLCRVLQLPATFEDTAISYYRRAFQHPALRAARIQKKEVLVGCCVLVTCRQHNWPLTMGTVCSLLYADLELFSAAYLQVVKLLGLDVPALSLADLVKTYCGSFKVSQASPSVPAKFAEDKEKLVSRTVQLVELASDTWLVTGRQPVPVITAAAYLAWQSLRPGGRLTCPLARFCQLAGVDLPHPAYLRLQELLAILLRMAGKLAWLRLLSPDKRTVVKHIGDLLQHRHLLIRRAFRERVEQDEEEDEEQEEREEEGPEEERRPQEEKGSDRPSVPQRGKRPASPPPLLPPCLLRPQKRPCPRPPDTHITGYEDISDSELEQYLRTHEEVKEFQKAQAASQKAVGTPDPS